MAKQVTVEKVEENEVEVAPEPSDLKKDEREFIEAQQALEYQYMPKEEKKVVRKLDWHIVSFVSALFMLQCLDSSNIGNANVAGMSKDIGATDGQFEWFLTIYYISYIVFEFLTYCWKIFPPRYYAPTVVICWGIISSCQAAVNSPGAMMAIRFLLGVFTAGFGPGVQYYFTLFYYRHELAWRIGIFMTMTPLASAYSGSLAYGITSHRDAIQGWRVLFLVEGLPTIAVGVLGYFFLPNDSNDTWFLTKHEKRIATARTAKQTGRVQRSQKLNFKEVLLAVSDYKVLIIAVMFFSINVSFSSLPVFLPVILEGMGFMNVKAQGMTAPPYVFSAILVLVVAYFSDRYMRRSLFLLGLTFMAGAGFLILGLTDGDGVRYFAVFLAVGGVFPSIAVIIAWNNNNQGSDSRRATANVLMQTIGQCGPVLGMHLFPASEGPLYRKGTWISFAFMVFIFVCVFVLRTLLIWENKKLDEKYGPVNSDDVYETLDSFGGENRNFRFII